MGIVLWILFPQRWLCMDGHVITRLSYVEYLVQDAFAKAKLMAVVCLFFLGVLPDKLATVAGPTLTYECGVAHVLFHSAPPLQVQGGGFKHIRGGVNHTRDWSWPRCHGPGLSWGRPQNPAEQGFLENGLVAQGV